MKPPEKGKLYGVVLLGFAEKKIVFKGRNGRFLDILAENYV